MVLVKSIPPLNNNFSIFGQLNPMLLLLFCFIFQINLAITIGVKILGPAAGFILGSFCTRYYVDLSNPGFGPNDPKWVGAWYLGKYFICFSQYSEICRRR